MAGLCCQGAILEGKTFHGRGSEYFDFFLFGERVRGLRLDVRDDWGKEVLNTDHLFVRASAALPASKY